MRKTTGFSLMLLIFLSLCLIVFSLLSLSGATADQSLSQKAADRTTSYYASVTAANQVLASIDEALAECLKKAEKDADPKASYLRACAALPDMIADPVSASTKDDSVSLMFQVPVTKDQILEVSLLVRYPETDDDTLCEITGWLVKNTSEWTPDTSQNVYRKNSDT